MADEQHKHEWVPIREGYPQKICKCGVLRVLGIKSGKNTITVNPSPASQEVIRWTSYHNPSVADLGMSSNGRPTFSFGTSTANEVQYAAGQAESSPGLFTRWQTNPALTTVTTVGTTTTFTVTSGGAAAVSTALGTYGFGITCTAAASGGDGGFIPSAFTECRGEANPNITFVFRTGSDISSVRYWIGLFSGTPMAGSAPAVSHAGFRYDTGVDGTAFWRCLTSAGGSQQSTTTTASATAGTTYVMRITSNGGGTWKFYVNGSGVASHSTTVPATTTNMGPVLAIRTLAASTRTIIPCRVSIGQVNITL
jgi:hypothetical protein